MSKVVDVLSTVLTLLQNNWDSSNTDDVTPVFGKVFEFKELDLANHDYVLVYEVVETHTPFAIGGASFEQESVVSIDLRTTFLNKNVMQDVRPHLVKMQDEVLRIIKANVSKPDSNFQLLLPVKKLDFSDKNAGIGRVVLDCAFKKWG